MDANRTNILANTTEESLEKSRATSDEVNQIEEQPEWMKKFITHCKQWESRQPEKGLISKLIEADSTTESTAPTLTKSGPT